MSRFYGSVSGQAQTTASRRGSANSGITAHPRGWDLGVRVSGYADGERDVFAVNMTGGTNGARSDVNVLTIEDIGDGIAQVAFGIDGFEHYYRIDRDGDVVEHHPLRQRIQEGENR